MRKRFLRALALAVVPVLGAFIIRLIYLTNKKVYHLPEHLPEEPFICALWHGDLLMQPYLYRQFRATPTINVLISEHFDGKIIAGVMRYFGFSAIRGSTTRGGAKALIQGIRSLKEGNDLGITPDGPKGPRHEVADGVVVMAQKTKAKVLAFTCVPSSYWQLNSWDRFMIPKPFGRLDFYASEPMDLVGVEFEEARERVKKALMEHTVSP